MTHARLLEYLISFKNSHNEALFELIINEFKNLIKKYVNKVLKDLEVRCPFSGLVNESEISILNLFPNNNGKLILKGKETNSTQTIEVDSNDILTNVILINDETAKRQRR